MAAAAGAALSGAPQPAAPTAGLALPPGGPPTYVARCVGLVSDADAAQLHTLLRGMCARRGFFEENEYGLHVPLQSGAKTGSFKMIKQVPASGLPLVPLGPSPPIIWRLVHESPPLTGQLYAGLPAAVLEVTESALFGIYSVQFLHHLGCSCRYRVQRRNWVYACGHEGHTVQVSVFSVLNRAQHGDEGRAPAAPLFPGQAVEARLVAGPEQQVEAARLLGSFCKKLLPLVVMKKV